MDATLEFLAQLGAFWRHQLAGVFLAPGSSLSATALLLTGLTAFLFMATAGKSRRFSVLIRALLPRRMWRSDSGKADLGWFLFSLLGGGTMIGVAILAADLVSGWTQNGLTSLFGASDPVSLPVWLSASIATVALFLAYEFAYWLDHSLMHWFDWTWEIHKVHHSAETLSLFTIFRVHPLETIGFYNIVALCMGSVGGMLHYGLGAASTPLTLGGTNAIMLVSAIFIVHLQHSHLWISFGPRIGRLILGPAHHQIHHSNDPAHFNRNFGNLLTLFDRMFGTFHMPEKLHSPLAFGTGDVEKDQHSLPAMTVRPMIRSLAMIAKAFASARNVAIQRDAGERA